MEYYNCFSFVISCRCTTALSCVMDIKKNLQLRICSFPQAIVNGSIMCLGLNVYLKLCHNGRYHAQYVASSSSSQHLHYNHAALLNWPADVVIDNVFVVLNLAYNFFLRHADFALLIHALSCCWCLVAELLLFYWTLLLVLLLYWIIWKTLLEVVRDAYPGQKANEGKSMLLVITLTIFFRSHHYSVHVSNTISIYTVSAYHIWHHSIPIFLEGSKMEETVINQAKQLELVKLLQKLFSHLAGIAIWFDFIEVINQQPPAMNLISGGHKQHAPCT